MISYQPFYETLLRENITEYALIFKLLPRFSRYEKAVLP